MKNKITNAQSQKRNSTDNLNRSKLKKLLNIRNLIILLLIFVISISGFLYWFINNKFDQINKVNNLTSLVAMPSNPSAPFNILIVGSDSRAFVKSKSQIKLYGTPPKDVKPVADTIMIARINPVTDQITILSIPRDTYVTVADNRGVDRIGDVFNYGPNLLISTIEQDFNIPINHYIQADFSGLVSFFGKLGTIKLDFRYKIKDTYTNFNVSKLGCQALSGIQVLELARSRHLYYLNNQGNWIYDTMSDWSRIRRQQVILEAIFESIKSQITNPFSIDQIVNGLTSNFSIDSNFNVGELIDMAYHYRNVSLNNIHFLVLPTTDFGRYGTTLFVAEPYANSTLNKLYNDSSNSDLKSIFKTTLGEVVPFNEVIFDNSSTSPEPWNPILC